MQNSLHADNEDTGTADMIHISSIVFSISKGSPFGCFDIIYFLLLETIVRATFIRESTKIIDLHILFTQNYGSSII